MKGDIATFGVEKRKDPQTGIEVTRLTDNKGETDRLNIDIAHLDKCIWSDR